MQPISSPHFSPIREAKARRCPSFHSCSVNGGREVTLDIVSGCSHGWNFPQCTVCYWIPTWMELPVSYCFFYFSFASGRCAVIVAFGKGERVAEATIALSVLPVAAPAAFPACHRRRRAFGVAMSVPSKSPSARWRAPGPSPPCTGRVAPLAETCSPRCREPAAHTCRPHPSFPRAPGRGPCSERRSRIPNRRPCPPTFARRPACASRSPRCTRPRLRAHPVARRHRP